VRKQEGAREEKRLLTILQDSLVPRILDIRTDREHRLAGAAVSDT
jgi:hypothetical protein